MGDEKPKRKKEWVEDAAIYSALRRAYRSSPAVNAALARCKEEYFITSKKGKLMRRVRFNCEAMCGAKPSRKGVQVDHTDPVVDPQDGNLLPDGTRNWVKQIKRLFVKAEALKVLCKPCHKAKSNSENAVRRKRKKELSK